MNRTRYRMLLTAEQSAALFDGGPRCSVAIVHPGSWPDSPHRMLLDLAECDRATADSLVGILAGTPRAIRILTPKP